MKVGDKVLVKMLCCNEIGIIEEIYDLVIIVRLLKNKELCKVAKSNIRLLVEDEKKKDPDVITVNKDDIRRVSVNAIEEMIKDESYPKEMALVGVLFGTLITEKLIRELFRGEND